MNDELPQTKLLINIFYLANSTPYLAIVTKLELSVQYCHFCVQEIEIYIPKMMMDSTSNYKRNGGYSNWKTW